MGQQSLSLYMSIDINRCCWRSGAMPTDETAPYRQRGKIKINLSIYMSIDKRALLALRVQELTRAHISLYICKLINALLARRSADSRPDSALTPTVRRLDRADISLSQCKLI